ncbi:MAG: FG-GAP-like repeat-containing protein [Candidatus Omnitrophota bacterium]|nr:FG-GAP-like repeat-containing protein [Candidatus Omnitrophota bacterium]
MRNLRVALLTIGTILSLISFRDKAVVPAVPDTNRPVAEAYHSPQAVQPAFSPAAIAAPSPVANIRSQFSTSSAEASPVETDPVFQENLIDASLNTASNNTKTDAATPPTVPASAAPATVAPTTIIYGFGGIDTSSGTGTDAGTNTAGNDTGGGGTTNPQSTPESENETNSSVFVTNLTPNSGIPGTDIVIQGAGFNSTASNNDVKFGTVSAASVTYVSVNQLRATVPQSGVSPGFANVSVTVNTVTSNNALFSVLKSSPGNVFEDDTLDLLPNGLTLTDSSIVRAADVDNDNDLDLLIVDSTAGVSYLLKNNGQGGFSSSVFGIADSSSITDAVFGDVNQDGYADIALTCSSGRSVRLLLNNGQGSFNDATAANLPVVSGNAVSLDLGDANGDGAPDIIAANTDVRDILLINDGDGVFTKDTGFNLPGVIDGSSDIRFCDLSGDGAVDIITANNEVVGASSLRNRVYMNNGQGQFTDITETVLPEDDEYSEVLDYGDIDADRDIDIVVANDSQNAILINKGNGVFENQTAALMPTRDFASKDTRLGDMNGDGYLDLVVLGEDNISLFLNDGSGSLKKDASIKLPDYKSTPALVGGKNVQVADINGDGALDIIVGGSSLCVLVNSASDKAPVLDHIGNRSIEFGKKLEFNVTGSDPNGDVLIFLAEGLPGTATFLSKMFRWVPAASDIGQHKNIRFIAREDKQAPLEAFEDITITVLGLPPIIDGYIPEELDLDLGIGEIVQFGIIAHDPAGGTLTFKWFLNNVQVKSVSGFASSLIFIVPRIGENIIEARVENSTGSDSVFWDVSVGVTQNSPPQITGYEPQESSVSIDRNTGGALSFAVTATDPDEGDDLLYAWKLDGNDLTTGSNLSASAFAGSASLGNHTLQVSVSDGHNAPVTHSWTITITETPQNRPPQITGYEPQDSVINIDPNVGGALSFAVTASDPDTGDTISYEWKIDGKILATDSSLSASAFAGGLMPETTHTLTVSVRDNHNASVTHSWTIHVTQGVVNNPPIAQNDAVVTNINTAADIDVLANDSDSDSDGNALSVSAASLAQPSHGSAVIVDNSIRYTPNNAYTGPDSFTYKATDGLLESNSATVSITVNAVNVEEMLNDIINRAFNYFWNETDNPSTGFVRDRLPVDPAKRNSADDTHYNMASMAATGFGLAAMCVAAERYGTDSDWQITPQDLAARAELILQKLLDIQASQSPDGDATWGKSGFFYHFVNIETGENWPNVEVSSIDTAILVAGALTAGEYFGGEVKTKAELLYANVDWNSFVDYAQIDHYGQFYKQWKPQEGFSGNWDYNDESVLLYLLAIGSPAPEHAVSPDLYYSARRELGSYGPDGKPIVRSWFGSLFAYQYVNAFFDLRDMHDDRNINLWQSAIDATIANRQFCMDQDGTDGYNQYVWGLSSAYSVGATYRGEYGAAPTGSPDGPVHDGTVNPSVVASSIGMLPGEVGQTLAYMKSDPLIWRQDSYGFVDSFKNSDPRVYSDYFVGLDLGASLVMTANYTDSGIIWNNFMKAATRYGTMRGLLTELKFRPNSDPKLYVDVDDISAKSQFAYGYIGSDKPTAQISFDLAEVVPNSAYALAIHKFMNNYAGSYEVSVRANLNGTAGGNMVFSHTADQPDDIEYIEIDSQFLRTGENILTLTWEDGASWFAWKNLEISSPIVNNEWNIIKSPYANEYRIDDTYYTGHFNKYGAEAYKTFEKALNIITDPYTDILFYIDDLGHDRKLTLKTSSSNGDVSVNVAVNGEPSGTDTTLSVQQPKEIIIPAGLLREGWNGISLVIKTPADGWLIWDNLKLELGSPAAIEAPKGLACASFGRDKVNLRWNSVAGSSIRYNVYRSQTQDGPYTKANPSDITSTQYQDTSLVNNNTCYYIVKAFEESVPSQETQPSAEVSVTTGPYQLDYKDGKDPNIFGGNTFDNNGYPLGNIAFTDSVRYDGTSGKVRKFILPVGQGNIIDMNTADINNATMLSFRVKSDAGGEKFKVILRDTSDVARSVSLEVPAGGVWQEMHFYISATFNGVNLSAMQRIEIISETTGRQINLYFDEVEFATIDTAGDRLDVKIRNGADDIQATGVDFGNATAENSRVLSNQYIEIDYVSSGSWGIQIFTDNKAPDASPRYTGTGDKANGLVGTTNSGYRVPVIWQVWQVKKGYYNGTETPEFDTTVDDGDRAEFAFIVDKSDSDWSVPYARNYRTLIDHDGLLGAPVPLASPGPGYWPRQGTAGQPVYVYLAADFTGAPAQRYTTNKLTIDIYHE